MNSKTKYGLGRGLEALLGEDDFSLDKINTEDLINSGIKMVKIEDLMPSSYQPRKDFNEEALKTKKK